MINDKCFMTGFGNDFATEAEKGALPVGRNSPQKPPMGLYAEQFSGTAFTAPRSVNRRTWTYRIRPSVVHGQFEPAVHALLRSTPFDEVITTPNQLRWNAFPFPENPSDFLESLMTIAGNGDSFAQNGIAIHIFAAGKDMSNRFFYNADGEMLVVAEMNRVRFLTELGVVDIEPGEIAVLPRAQIPRRTSRWESTWLCVRKLRFDIWTPRTRSNRIERAGQFARF